MLAVLLTVEEMCQGTQGGDSHVHITLQLLQISCNIIYYKIMVVIRPAVRYCFLLLKQQYITINVTLVLWRLYFNIIDILCYPMCPQSFIWNLFVRCVSDFRIFLRKVLNNPSLIKILIFILPSASKFFRLYNLSLIFPIRPYPQHSKSSSTASEIFHVFLK